MTEILPFKESETQSLTEQNNVLMSPRNSAERVHNESDDNCNDHNNSFKDGLRNHNNRLSDSESDLEITNTDRIRAFQPTSNASSDSDDYSNIIRKRSSNLHKKILNSDVSESDLEQSQEKENLLNIDKGSLQKRTVKKRNKLREKIQNLLNSKETINASKTDQNELFHQNQTSSSDDEMASINIIKQKIKERSNTLKMSICDPDSSEDESNHLKHVQEPRKKQKRSILTSPKPQRISAKQAMENMHKIKSESNRMLREKEVSLPYHRPKALSLKDIMSRRKPAVSSDGKILPIKMNEEQLKQFALQLEQRQKEMIELCKSDTEDEEDNEASEQIQCMSDSNTASDQILTKIDDTVCEPEPLAKCNVSMKMLNSDVDSNISNDTTKVDNGSRHVEKSNEVSNISNNNFEVSEDVHDKSKDVSTEMELVYNDSLEEPNEVADDLTSEKKNCEFNAPVTTLTKQNKSDEANSCDSNNQTTTNILDMSESKETNQASAENLTEKDSQGSAENLPEKDSQLISLLYDTEENDSKTLADFNNISNEISKEEVTDTDGKRVDDDQFPDDDLDGVNIDDIDNIIENEEMIRNDVPNKKYNSPALVKQNTNSLKLKPKLMGAPGMLIDLDGSDATVPKKLTGVELLKERFCFFAKLKTPEELERERERRQKPGTQHIKLKQELEEKIATQRSLEWTKRLENEKQQQKELNSMMGEASDVENEEDDIDKIEAKLRENEAESKRSSDSEEEEEEVIEDDVLIEDKPRKKNHLVADEAEESDMDDGVQSNIDEDENQFDAEDDNAAENDEQNDVQSEEDSSENEESSESEDDQEMKPKKSRILKAFEDSDDDESDKKISIIRTVTLERDELHSNKKDSTSPLISQIGKTRASEDISKSEINTIQTSDNITESQDEDLQLAQVPKTNSEEIFTSQESISNKPINSVSDCNDVDLGSQTFSIVNPSSVLKTNSEINVNSQEKTSILSETQPVDDNLDIVAGLCSGSLSQNYIEFKPPSTQSQNLESQPLGDDILDMCTGKFYDNQLVTQTDDNVDCTSLDITPDSTVGPVEGEKKCETIKKADDVLKSVLDELNESEIEYSKPMKFFCDGKNKNEGNEHSVNNSQMKKKFVIDSDDDITDEPEKSKSKKKKIIKKKKPEQRALQISDDENEDYSEQENDYMSDNEDLQNNDEERLVEYDSEENEIEVKQRPQKKKRKAAEFFEQEAELTSEDEWCGSGDEDEAGLDRMEREAGDDDAFHQGRLQAELGQIHARDILDQDKREVRLIQELLFEDGDLGGGGRQRKFRWRTEDGEDVTGTIPNDLMDTQEEEFESEEQWRKQRHEREVFLRQLKNEDKSEDVLNISVNRTTIIKANLLSRTMSSILEDQKPDSEIPENTTVSDKKIVKDIPSPKKPFPVFKQNYHGSLLTRGRGALARLAALATPLAVDVDAPKIGLIATSSKRNFVFAAITPEDKELKVTKRKADVDVGTPRLVKKMRKEEKKQPKNSLLDHLMT
ncbi:hypothetical protein evm_007901 [Chilo suppressalis]|nr:hypothetical protein evm_007901 [Chilo suppressalis]